MTLAEIKLENAQAELALAIISGNKDRELDLRERIAMLQEHEPVDKPENYSVHTVVIEA